MPRLELDFHHNDNSLDTPLFTATVANLAELDLIAAHGKPELPAEPDGAAVSPHPDLAENYPEIDLKRAFDILTSVALLLLLMPIMLLIGLLIFVMDGGPPIYRHSRIGRNCETFSCLKFRSMRVNADAEMQKLLERDPKFGSEWQNGFKLQRDPRVTRLGKLLRDTSLDELPQLFNVLRGDMSLVGPRPIVMAEMPRYGRYIAHYLSVRPGLTGLWQISGRSTTTYRRRVAADVLYVRLRSFSLDLRILVNTIPAVLTGKGSC
jgi:exopolysaccharide production protein ExoY